MNKIFKYIGRAALCSAALVACTPDEFDSPNGGARLKAADYAGNVEISVDQQTNNAYFTFRPAAGVTPVWLIDGTQYNSDFTCKKYQRKAGKYDLGFMVKNANGLSVDTVWFDYTMNKTIMNGFAGFDVDSDDNLCKTAKFTQASGYYAPGWSQVADPTVIYGKGTDFTVQLPLATSERWQAQVPFETTICTVAEEGKTYDFSCILTSTKDFKAMIKLTNPHDDNDFYFAEEQAMKAGEPICFYMTGLPSRTIDNLKLFFDFGGCPENTEVAVENIVFIESSKNTIVAPEKDVPEPVWVDVNSSDNLWNVANPRQIEGYYAPGWAQIPDPSVVVSDGKIMIKLPEATFERWQAQVPFLLDLAIDDVDTEYDFLAVIESNTSFKPMVKLTDATDDNNFFFADDSKALVEGGELRFFQTKVKLSNPCEALKLFFDFGGNPANTEITISNIILQKHKE